MLLTKNWIYLDLQKTGCTFLRRNLLEIFPENIFVQTAKHSIPEIKLNIPKIITIRDPKKYYFSLWSYGIDQKGALLLDIGHQLISVESGEVRLLSSLSNS